MANLACGYCSTKTLPDAEVGDGFSQSSAASKATLSTLSAASPLGHFPRVQLSPGTTVV